MFFDTGEVTDLQSAMLRLRFALETAEKKLGSEVTILYNISGYKELREMVETMSRKEGGPWQCYKAAEFYGCEADKVFLLLIIFHFDDIVILFTRWWQLYQASASWR